MEFLTGLSLDALVKEFGPMPSGRVVYLLRQACGALREAHAAQLIHRDIKPGNIFAAERGGVQDVVKLLDFGLVKSTTSNEKSLELTSQGALVGSPMFASPDMVLGESLDSRSDIYSIGATAYYLLTGQPVFRGANAVQMMFAHANKPVTPPRELEPKIDPELERILLKCLEKQPADRYGNMDELLEDLEQCSCDWSAITAQAWWQNHDTLLPAAKSAGSTDQFAATAIVTDYPVPAESLQ